MTKPDEIDFIVQLILDNRVLNTLETLLFGLRKLSHAETDPYCGHCVEVLNTIWHLLKCFVFAEAFPVMTSSHNSY